MPRSRWAQPMKATLAEEASAKKVLIIVGERLGHKAERPFYVCTEENTTKHSCIYNAHQYFHYLRWLWPMAAAVLRVVLGVCVVDVTTCHLSVYFSFKVPN